MKLKKQLIAVQWKNGQKSEAELDPELTYFFHAFLTTPFDPVTSEDGIGQYVVSLSEQSPNYDEPCWIVSKWIFDQLKTIRVERKI